MATITVVGEDDLDDLLPLMRAYCDFYAVTPSDDDLLTLCRAMVLDPEREGLQLLARDERGRAIGFATVFWLWSTLAAARIGLMNDLFVAPDARGGGVADELIRECAARVRERGGKRLEWQTAHDNHRAQIVYDRAGGRRDDGYLDYSLDISS